MSRFAAGFSVILFFIVMFGMKKTSAQQGKSVTNATPTPIGTKHCNNVYFYEAPNKKIENLLKEMKKQLTQVQRDFNILKENKGSPKGEDR